MRILSAVLNVACFLLSSSILGQVLPMSDSVGVGMVDNYRYFDQPIDQEIYLIRPGDELVVTFIKAKLAPLTLSVNPEGKVVDATLGLFDLSHKTLSEAKGLLREALQKLYNVEEIAISVTKPAKVGILVSGAVTSSGLYTAYTSQRVSEVIDSAGGITCTGSHRWIVFSGGPQEIVVDLDRAGFLGDNAANPCLYAGYSIYVPSKSGELVQVVGEVNSPREIELKPGDDLDLLLALAGGVCSKGDVNSIRIIGEHRKSSGQSQDIRAGDIILVPPKEEKSKSGLLIIFGAISAPGKYEYRDGITLQELIQQAGGFAPHASHSRTTVFRKAEVDEWGRTTSIRYPISNVVKGHDKVEVIRLQPFDSVFVPVKVGYVKVSGEVRNPGLLPFVENKDAIFYINVAGGFLQTANRSQIDIYNRVSRITSSFSPEVLVHDGDDVIVNIREELK